MVPQNTGLGIPRNSIISEIRQKSCRVKNAGFGESTEIDYSTEIQQQRQPNATQEHDSPHSYQHASTAATDVLPEDPTEMAKQDLQLSSKGHQAWKCPHNPRTTPILNTFGAADDFLNFGVGRAV